MRNTRRSSHSPRWPPKPRKSLQSTSPSSPAKRSVGMFHRTPAHHFCRLFPWLTSPRYLSTGEPGFLHQRSHQGQPAECDALLLRPSAAADIRADGKGLISPVPALRTLLGLNQPKKGQLHLNLILIIKDPRKTKTKPEH